MRLLLDVLAYLEARYVAAALIGGSALAAHGVARATLDSDVLVVDAAALRHDFWAAWTGAERREIFSGDADDPMAGMVRCSQGDEIVDVVVGRPGWLTQVLERRTSIDLGERAIPVVDRADLALLKLYAGGPQDLVDVQLLLASDPQGLDREIEERLGAVPAAVRTAWRRVREQGTGVP